MNAVQISLQSLPAIRLEMRDTKVGIMLFGNSSRGRSQWKDGKTSDSAILKELRHSAQLCCGIRWDAAMELPKGIRARETSRNSSAIMASTSSPPLLEVRQV